MFSPLAWFHGTVALTYGIEAFFSALMGYMCWHIDRGKAKSILPTAILLGISAGIRPSSLLFLGPLFLFSLRRATIKRILLGCTALALTLIAWFVPMIWASGGADAYFGALVSLWRLVPSKDTVYNSSPPLNSPRMRHRIHWFSLLWRQPAGIAGRALQIHSADPAKKHFTAAWMLPALCFFTFIFLKFVNQRIPVAVGGPGEHLARLMGRRVV